jgi:predicted dinucleotide-binding enzyme
MKIGILGTGHVAQSLGDAWRGAGHDVTLGSRDPEGRPDLGLDVAERGAVVASADVVVNATLGRVSVDAAQAIGAGAFAGKVLIDVANANTPDFQLVYPNASLAEALQEALPEAKVVKALNTFNTSVMVHPSAVPPSSTFISGDDAEAKATVASLLQNLGWPADAIIDLGPIASARGPEHYFLMFAALLQAFGSPVFNIRVVRGKAA